MRLCVECNKNRKTRLRQAWHFLNKFSIDLNVYRHDLITFAYTRNHGTDDKDTYSNELTTKCQFLVISNIWIRYDNFIRSFQRESSMKKECCVKVSSSWQEWARKDSVYWRLIFMRILFHAPPFHPFFLFSALKMNYCIFCSFELMI